MYRILALIVWLAASAAGQWQPQESNTKESLRGISVVDESIAWASGTHGTYLLTVDGGQTWKPGQVPGAEGLDFRDVHGFGFSAFLLAAGPGERSRIYKTNDRGNHWELQFTNHDPKGFFDCMAFWDEKHGIAVGDPVDGRFQIITTEDGGKTWKYVDRRRIPEAIEGEGAFAASGTCIATEGQKNAWFVTGGAAARVFRSSNRGRSWKVSETPIQHGIPSAGIFSVAFRDARHGVIAGGDYSRSDAGGANLATTDDGGKTWKPAKVAEQEYFSGIAYVTEGGGLAAVGSSGSAFSEDGLKSWKSFLPEGFNAVAGAPLSGVAWAAGANGKIAKAVLGYCGAHCESRKER
ncbi:MAG: glycosyl hydrolase [Acidobacteriia bacterium]|nr:glycosyl hydrolase [Terriglobia bacterium]